MIDKWVDFIHPGMPVVIAPIFSGEINAGKCAAPLT
jgi:hypothetical protein